MKAIRILRCFTHEEPQRSLADIVAITKMPRTICYRLLSTFRDEGLVDKDSSTGKYRLDMALFAMASTALGISNLSTIASHYMSQLSAHTHDTVLLLVEHNLEAMCIARVDGDFPIQQNALTIGKSWPLHVGGAPFCILSYMPEERRESILSQPLRAFTRHTVTDPVRIRERIAGVRERGYAIGNEDAIDYLVAIGVPIFGHGGRLVSALSIGGLTQRYPKGRIEEVAQLARRAADNVSVKLGYELPGITPASRRDEYSTA